MGRPPHSGGPAFRFTPNEVVEMEACLQEANNAVPSKEIISSLADKFSVSADRVGKIVVQPKQVWNWFQNKRYAQRAKLVKAPGSMPQDDSVTLRNVTHAVPVPSGRNALDSSQMEFEAKSVRDGAWYDVSTFVSHRMFETGDPEVRVRFSGFGAEEDEWVNVRECVRQRSLPCDATECVLVLPGDLILCFQEGKEQALYFDAHVLDAQRRRHDVRGCRCRFLVRYDHDHSEEIVPLRKVCRRPETDYRLQQLHASKELASLGLRNSLKDSSLVSSSSRDFNSTAHKARKHQKLIDAAAEETVTSTCLPHQSKPAGMENTPTVKVENNPAIQDAHMGDAAMTSGSNLNLQGT